MSTESASESSVRTPANGEPVLRVAEVTKAFHRGPPWHRRTRQVLRGASLDVRAGELVRLVGENGSGKSTLMQIIVGYSRATPARSSARHGWATARSFRCCGTS
jgi:ABC-type glutathione transport system ATPase component